MVAAAPRIDRRRWARRRRLRDVRRAAMNQTQHDPKNEAEITYWNSAGGCRWVERQQSQDMVLGPILQATLERAQLRQGERVVDIGCEQRVHRILAEAGF